MSDSDKPTLPGNGMTESKWESLPADSEAEKDYEKIPAWPAPTQLPFVGTDYREVRVVMEVALPDGARFSYEEVTEIPEGSELDPYAQALESAREVAAVMITRMEGTQL